MVKDIYYPSSGKGIIHALCWEPDGAVKGVVQIIHGISEYAKRYSAFAKYLNSLGYLVVAEDHMGHGKSGGKGCVRGYFHGGWFRAVEDSYQLLESTRAEHPNVPYVIFGHSMGSFMARTMLIKYPNSGISGAVICGTGWMAEMIVKTGRTAAKAVCRMKGETQPNKMLHNLLFASYNKKVEHYRTPYDWLNRDSDKVDAYIADPLCGFPETAGLARDMLEGILFIQKADNLKNMKRNLPVLFIAGGDDPVGDYGKGVKKAAEKFKQIGMKKVSCKIYPLCRHEILNEINYQEVFDDVAGWLDKNTAK